MKPDWRRPEMKRGTPQIAALARSLQLLEALLGNEHGRSVAAVADELGLPRATAHRQVSTLVAEGFLSRLPGRRTGPGPRLLALLKLVDEKQLVVAAAAPVLHRLAAELQCVVQLGTLENDMVTYRIKTGRGAGDFFTKVGLQLEAYCTGIGKVLLAHLSLPERESYLSTGPFPALTANTITDPQKMWEELLAVAEQGFARDDEEIADGLACLAVPVHSSGGRVFAAISASRAASGHRFSSEHILAKLQLAARQIEADIYAGSES